MTFTKYVETYLGTSSQWPGTSDNPMRPIMYKDPETGEEKQAHYNDRNLSSDRDYKDAGFEYAPAPGLRGWCWPVRINS